MPQIETELFIETEGAGGAMSSRKLAFTEAWDDVRSKHIAVTQGNTVTLVAATTTEVASKFFAVRCERPITLAIGGQTQSEAVPVNGIFIGTVNTGTVITARNAVTTIDQFVDVIVGG